MKPLTLRMAQALRRMRDAAPHWVLAGSIIRQHTRRGIRDRGLSSDGYQLNAAGMRLARALGDVPTDPWGNPLKDQQWCGGCGYYLHPAYIAWDEYDGAPDASPPSCINCLANRWGYP